MSDQETTLQENVSPSRVSAILKNNNQVRLKGKGCLYGGTIVGGGCLLVVVAILVVPMVLGMTTFDRILSGISSIFEAASARATVLSSQTIVESIQPMGQLVTVSAQLAKINQQINVSQGVLNMCAYRVNHAVQGTIEAGIDLTQIGADALRYDTARETYILTVPAPQLTSCRIDEIQQYDWSVSTCNPDWDGARLLANYTALNQFREDAVEGGILRRAENETRLVLGNFVRLLTGHPIEIIFAQTESTMMPTSCNPEPPQGWMQNPTDNSWSK